MFIKKIACLNIILFFFLSLKAATLKSHLDELYPDYKFTQFLGKGYSAEIWGSEKHIIAIKIQPIKNSRTFERFSTEYQHQCSAYEALCKYDASKNLRQRAHFVKPENITLMQDKKACAFFMEQLYPLQKHKKICSLNLRGSSYYKTKQLVNAYPNISDTRTNIEQICFDMGTLLAILHLDLNNDSHDIEPYLVKRSRNSNLYKIAIVDFGWTKNLRNLCNNKHLNDFITCLLMLMVKRNYCPLPNNPGFYHFIQGYSNIAASLDAKNKNDFYQRLTKKLFKHYINYWIETKIFSTCLNCFKKPRYKLFPKWLLVNKANLFSLIHEKLSSNDYFLKKEELVQFIEACYSHYYVLLRKGKKGERKNV